MRDGLETLPFQHSRFRSPEYVAFQFVFVLGLLRKFSLDSNSQIAGAKTISGILKPTKSG